jgi:CO dehydrogenase maturation factor
LVERGIKPLLAVDADPNSCLPERLGITIRQTIGDMREELRQDPESVPAGVSKREWIEQLIHEDIAEAPGIDMLVMGRQEGPGCYCYINSVLREYLGKIGAQYRGVVIDNEAGLEHLSRRTNGQVEVMLVVCPPNVIGARTAARIVDIKNHLGLEVGAVFLVLNPCDQPLAPELAALFAQSGLEILAAVPTDSQVSAFDVAGRPLLELPADSRALSAVRGLVNELAERKLL